MVVNNLCKKTSSMYLLSRKDSSQQNLLEDTTTAASRKCHLPSQACSASAQLRKASRGPANSGVYHVDVAHSN